MRFVLTTGALVLLLACGAGGSPETASLRVEGMHCDGCSAAITDALTGVEGVESAWADHETGRAEAVFRPDRTSQEALTAAVEDLGYTVVEVTTGPAG